LTGHLTDYYILKNNYDPCSHVEVSLPLVRETKYKILMEAIRHKAGRKNCISVYNNNKEKTFVSNMLKHAYLNS